MKIFPENASTYGQDIDNIFWLILVFATIAFVISLFILFYPLVKNHYRRSLKAQYFTGEKKRHFRWVAMAMVALAVSDFIILFVEHDAWAKTQQQLPAADLHIAITGRQWNWIFQYPGPDNKLYTGDDVVVDQMDSELHVPINKNVQIDIKAKDVLHSVFIPAFRFKYDAIPGRTISRWFNATKEGTYDIACAEICGIMHSKMRNFLVVESQEKFDRFIQQLYNPVQQEAQKIQ